MMLPVSFRATAAAWLLCANGQSIASDADGSHFAQCPASVITTAPAQEVGAPWQVVPDSSAHATLAAVRFYSGHPSEMANLAPDGARRRGRSEITTWQLPEDAERSYWMACTYHHTASLLVRPLPASIRRCEVRSESRPSGTGVNVLEVSCR